MNNIEQTLSIIKPDAVERNLDNKIKEMFKKKILKLLKRKKYRLKKQKLRNFIKSMKQNLFIMICVLIYLLDL